MLHCKECEEIVFLRAGNIRDPHFAHAKGSNCPSSTIESFESMKGKRLLVNLAKRSISDAEIKTKQILPSGYYCAVLIHGEKDIVLDFHYNCLQNINYDERSKYYIDNSIAFLHVFSGNYEGKVRYIGMAERDTIQSLQGYCVFLNMYPEENKIRIYYQMFEKHPRSGKYEVFDYEDRIDHFIINIDGELCYNNKTVKNIIEEFRSIKVQDYEKIKKDIEWEKAEEEERKQKAIELRRQLEEKEKEEAQKRLEEIEKRKLEFEQNMKRMREEDEERQLQWELNEEKRREEAEQHKKEIDAENKKFYDERLSINLIREDLSLYKKSDYSIKLKVINEVWVFPYLFTISNNVCPIKADIRFNYIKSFEFWLYFANEDQKKRLIESAERRINNFRHRDEWIRDDYLKDFIIMKKCNNCIDHNEFLCIHKIISYGDLWCDSLHACFVSGIKVCTRVNRTCEYCKYSEILEVETNYR